MPFRLGGWGKAGWGGWRRQGDKNIFISPAGKTCSLSTAVGPTTETLLCGRFLQEVNGRKHVCKEHDAVTGEMEGGKTHPRTWQCYFAILSSFFSLFPFLLPVAVAITAPVVAQWLLYGMVWCGCPLRCSSCCGCALKNYAIKVSHFFPEKMGGGREHGCFWEWRRWGKSTRSSRSSRVEWWCSLFANKFDDVGTGGGGNKNSFHCYIRTVAEQLVRRGRFMQAAVI